MIGWIRETLSLSTGQLSTKRHVVVASAGVLCAVTVGLGIASTVWIWRNGDLGAGAVSALTFVAGILAGLAGSAYRKQEKVGVAAPPAPGVRASASDSTPEGAKIEGQP